MILMPQLLSASLPCAALTGTIDLCDKKASSWAKKSSSVHAEAPIPQRGTGAFLRWSRGHIAR